MKRAFSVTAFQLLFIIWLTWIAFDYATDIDYVFIILGLIIITTSLAGAIMSQFTGTSLVNALTAFFTPIVGTTITLIILIVAAHERFGAITSLPALLLTFFVSWFFFTYVYVRIKEWILTRYNKK